MTRVATGGSHCQSAFDQAALRSVEEPVTAARGGGVWLVRWHALAIAVMCLSHKDLEAATPFSTRACGRGSSEEFNPACDYVSLVVTVCKFAEVARGG